MAASLPSAGEMFAGKYRLARVLGEGGYARVFDAIDETLTRPVAIKVLTPRAGGNEVRHTQRFLREMKVIAGLSHPNIVVMYDYGRTDDGLWYMVFERVGGADLADLIARGPIPEDAAVRVLRQILEALRTAHAAGVLHRDIKPENIRIYEYLGDPWRAKLLDFGIATNVETDVRLTGTGKVVGTPRFMAPEQLSGKALGPPTDLYSLGLVALEMLTGKESRNIVHLANETRVMLPAHLELRESTRAVIDRLLEPNPSARFQSAADALERLASQSAPAPEVRPHVGPAGPPRRFAPAAAVSEPGTSRRSRTVGAAALAGGAIALLLALFLANHVGERDRAVPRERASLPSRLLVAREAPRVPARSAPVATDVDAGVAEADAGVGAAGPCGAPAPFTGGRHFKAGFGTWWIYVPQSYQTGTRQPVLVIGHPLGWNGSSFAEATGLLSHAERDGVVVIAPDAQSSRGWSKGPKDVRSVRRMLLEMERELCLDRDRVWVLGHGRGGYLASALACEEWVTAVATNAFTYETDGWVCEVPKPTLQLLPLETGFAPRDGGSTCTGGSKYSFARMEEWGTEKNRCDPASRRETKMDHGTCFDWACETPFATCHISGGFRWPGVSTPLLGDVLDCEGPDQQFAAADKVWEFFTRVSPADDESPE